MKVRIENAGFSMHFGLRRPPTSIMVEVKPRPECREGDKKPGKICRGGRWVPYTPELPEEPHLFEIGDRVRSVQHPEWGIGIVRSVYDSLVLVVFRTKTVELNVEDVYIMKGERLYIKFAIPWLDLLPGIPYEPWIPVLPGFKIAEEP